MGKSKERSLRRAGGGHIEQCYIALQWAMADRRMSYQSAGAGKLELFLTATDREEWPVLANLLHNEDVRSVKEHLLELGLAL